MQDDPVVIPLGTKPSSATALLPFMYTLALAIGLTGIGFLVFLPGHLKWVSLSIFSVLLIYMLGVLFLRSIMLHAPSLEFTDWSVALKSPTVNSEVFWRDATSLSLARSVGGAKARPFPVAVVLKPEGRMNLGGLGRGGSILALQVGGDVEPEIEEQFVSELVRRTPAAIVDVELPVLHSMLRAIVSSRLLADDEAVSWRLNPADSGVQRGLRNADPRDAHITAPFEYFLGNIEKARRQCAAGLSLGPNAWDLLLCRALCERSLGDEAAYRELLRASLEASPPPEVALVLAHALEVA